jgi:hypothetical protein
VSTTRSDRGRETPSVRSPGPAPPDVEKRLAARAARRDGKEARGAVMVGLCRRRAPGPSPRKSPVVKPSTPEGMGFL